MKFMQFCIILISNLDYRTKAKHDNFYAFKIRNPLKQNDQRYLFYAYKMRLWVEHDKRSSQPCAGYNLLSLSHCSAYRTGQRAYETDLRSFGANTVCVALRRLFTLFHQW